MPYSVTTKLTSPRVVATPAPSLRWETMREIFPLWAVEGIATMEKPPFDMALPRRKSTWSPIPL